jgi:2-oxo-4-hydroxy-4-carboxy-5-ureidoimidazoline decarboxylase
MGKEDHMEAFASHPKIGEKSLREKFGSTADWAEGEQAGASGADEATLTELAALNESYHQRYGYIFLVCATGKSALEMLEILRSRMDNAPDDEIAIAAGEQNKITSIRLNKLLDQL